MSGDDDDGWFMLRNDLTAEEIAQRIAAVLRTGTPTRAFLKTLAHMFDPPRRTKPTWRAVVQAPTRKDEKQREKRRRMIELAAAIRIHDGEVEAAVKHIMAKTGKGRSTVMTWRAQQRDRENELRELAKRFAEQLEKLPSPKKS